MSVKNYVLSALENNRGEYISGENLAKSLGVSRQSVSKAVKQLESDGYKILSSTNKGYMLDGGCDIISATVLEQKTGAKVFCFDQVTSTNTVALEKYCSVGECMVISLSQTKGKKKDGGVFPSPDNKGIYLTIALPLSVDIKQFENLRQKCAKIVKDVICSACGKNAYIENTDEIFIDGKKVCGILIETTVNTATLKTECGIFGIGIYTSQKCFEDTCLASIFPNEPRNEMISEIYLQIRSLVHNLR